MTRKDFVLIANALKSGAMEREHVISAAGNIVHLNRNEQLMWFACVTAMVRALELHNPRFEAKRFFDACGVPS